MLGRQDVTPELFAEIRDLAHKDDMRSLITIDPDFFGFICGRCDRPYCQDCWTNVYPTFDDGFYDETRGTCPRGHEQSLDD